MAPACLPAWLLAPSVLPVSDLDALQANEEGLKERIAAWNPKEDTKAKGDAYKTLFIAKISYDTTEKKLRREFEQYGPIASLRMVQDEDGKPRG